MLNLIWRDCQSICIAFVLCSHLGVKVSAGLVSYRRTGMDIAPTNFRGQFGIRFNEAHREEIPDRLLPPYSLALVEMNFLERRAGVGLGTRIVNGSALSSGSTAGLTPFGMQPERNTDANTAIDTKESLMMILFSVSLQNQNFGSLAAKPSAQPRTSRGSLSHRACHRHFRYAYPRDCHSFAPHGGCSISVQPRNSSAA